MPAPASGSGLGWPPAVLWARSGRTSSTACARRRSCRGSFAALRHAVLLRRAACPRRGRATGQAMARGRAGWGELVHGDGSFIGATAGARRTPAPGDGGGSGRRHLRHRRAAPSWRRRGPHRLGQATAADGRRMQGGRRRPSPDAARRRRATPRQRSQRSSTTSSSTAFRRGVLATADHAGGSGRTRPWLLWGTIRLEAPPEDIWCR